MNWIDDVKNYSEPVELFRSEIQLSEINYQDCKLRDFQSKEVCGQAVRILHNDRIGTVKGSIQDDFQQLVKRAKELAPFGRIAAFKLPEHTGNPVRVNFEQPRIDELSTNDLIHYGRLILDKFENQLPNWTIHLKLVKGTGFKHLVSSRGMDKKFNRSAFYFIISLINARENDIVELFDGRERVLTEDELDFFVADAAGNALRALDSAELSPGKYPVIFHPNAVNNYIAPLFTGIDGKMVFEGLSPLKNKRNDTIMDERITIIDDPLNQDLSDYIPFGDEGIAMNPLPIVQKGQLKTFINNCDYAARLDQPSTGHGRRLGSFAAGNTPAAEPSIEVSNIHIYSGDVSINDMISSISKGMILIESYDVWSGNMISGSVSGSVHLGYIIENGRIGGRIKNMRVSGNIYTMFGDQLEGISSDVPDTYNRSFKAPYLLMKDVSLA